MGEWHDKWDIVFPSWDKINRRNENTFRHAKAARRGSGWFGFVVVVVKRKGHLALGVT